MAKKKKIVEDKFITALKFVSLAQQDKGLPHQTHVLIQHNMAIAYDGILSAGHPIDEDLQACPHTKQLLTALKKCKGQLSLAQINNGTQLHITSGQFSAKINCAERSAIQLTNIDPMVAQIDNSLRKGLNMVSPIILENSQRVITAAAYIRPNTILATNGNVILEYWHGFDVPPGLIVPKLFINALAKIDKDIVGFGFSNSTFTVYFMDGSWLKTQLYNETWPNCDRVLNIQTNPLVLPLDFAEAIETVAPFIEDDKLRLLDDGVASHDTLAVGAHYTMALGAPTITHNAKMMKIIADIATSADWAGNGRASYFFGENVRGAITMVRK